MNSKQGSGKRPLQERNFEIVVNHITTNEDQLPQVSRQSIAALKNVFGHNIKKYPGTFHHKPGNDHVHILVVSEAPKTKSAVKVPIAASMALIFGTETGFVEVKMFNEMTADAGPAHGLKGLGDYRSYYHRPCDTPQHVIVVTGHVISCDCHGQQLTCQIGIRSMSQYPVCVHRILLHRYLSAAASGLLGNRLA